MYEMDKHKFGAFVAALRKEKGLTQKDLAAKLYISDKAISKWETGVSIPDVALLIPLAESLDVTVTELLNCHRIPQTQPIDPIQVEDLVKQAIRYSDEDPQKKRQVKKAHILWYALCCCIAAAGIIALHLFQFALTSALLTTVGMCAGFGFYFMFLANEKLPAYYDQNRINFYSDGPMRMNVPGLRFNNRNWPHILRVLRVWAMSTLALYPALSLVMNLLLPEFWLIAELYFMLAILLGGMSLPMYIVGKKYA